jgi:ribosome-interacting GTPase 1
MSLPPHFKSPTLTNWQCNSIHKTIVDNFKHAIVYGKSCKHQPQRVGLSHELADEDIGTYPSITILNG